MRVPFIDLASQYKKIQADVDAAYRRVMQSGVFIGGEEVAQFEHQFLSWHGGGHFVGTGSGSDALFLTMKALGIGPGDEVITTALSWVATASSISLTGAKPVFVDIDTDYFTIDPSKITEKITTKTKAVLPVHLYGQAADIAAIVDVCKQHHIALIEDCAQAHGTSYQGQPLGTFGEAGAFSFYPTKTLGALGNAGGILCSETELKHKCKMLANQGGIERNEHLVEGINSGMDSLQAAFLRVSLKYADGWRQKRKEIASHYRKNLSAIEEITLPQERPDSTHSYYLFIIRAKKRDQLKAYLESKNIQTAIHYPAPIPLLPAYKKYGLQATDYPQATLACDEILSLPIYPELGEDKLAYVCATISKFYQG